MRTLLMRQATREAFYQHFILPALLDAGPIRMIRFPNNMLNTISTLPQPPTATGHRSRVKQFDIARLPNEILLMIFDYLDVFDSATLALTCKYLAGVASTYSKLDMPTETMSEYTARKPHQAGHFLKKRLGNKYFSKRLKYCWGCKIYVPRRKSHWKRKLGQKCWIAHRASVTFAEWWALPQIQNMLMQWYKGKALKCPRCKFSKSGFSLVR